MTSIWCSRLALEARSGVSARGTYAGGDGGGGWQPSFFFSLIIFRGASGDNEHGPIYVRAGSRLVTIMEMATHVRRCIAV